MGIVMDEDPGDPNEILSFIFSLFVLYYFSLYYISKFRDYQSP
jgi:hypothetical protein